MAESNSRPPRPIRATAAAVRRGEVSARVLVEEAGSRHAASDLGAFVLFDAAGAMDQAAAVDRAVERGEDPGPLAGLTVSVKDVYGVEGLPIQAGTRRRLSERWQAEGFLVGAMRSLGAVLVGKTHTVELAFGGVGINHNTGTPVNPWDASDHRVPGGSSAGAGVSLLEGSAAVALGSDTGGSVRIPASATGTVGMRHTTGRWPTTGVFPLSTTLDTVGFLARTASDMRYVFQAVDALPEVGMGLGGARPGAKPDPAAAPSVRGLRIGVPKCADGEPAEGLWERSELDVAAVVWEALSELETVGAELISFEAPELVEAGVQYLSGSVVQPELGEALDRYLPGWADFLDPTVRNRLRSVRDVPAVEYLGLLRNRHRLSRALHARMDQAGLDCLATPTLPITVPRVADLEDLAEYGSANRLMLSNTCPASMLDMCAVSLPAGLDPSLMPVGLQLIARTGADCWLVDVAVAVESVLGTGLQRLGTPPRLPPGA
ncbi:MAG: amidase [Gemmatimonadetes bacterium]|nr:amidase [Gemmatimonadota bacterium]